MSLARSEPNAPETTSPEPTGSTPRLTLVGAPAPSWSEAERLMALTSFNVLDTPREADFDEIVSLASAICETPIAVVNLIDAERQWFKAEVGLGVRETPLATSFCRHAILADDFMMVADATLDPRFECNPLVTGEPGLRFYAGALLKAQGGLPIGTLCVLDTTPRQLSEVQITALRVLARQIMKQLELRQSLALQRLLMTELAHRVKNTFATIQAIANQTFRDAQDQAANATFSERIVALSRAHDILLAESWSSARLSAVVEGALAAHGGNEAVARHGPDLTLGPKAVLSLALMLHELATNAAKYGALSSPAGRISLTWTIEAEDGPARLVMIWCESGGPLVAAPSRKGFGSRLLRMGLVGAGGVTIDYAPGGVVCRMEAQIGHLRQAE